MRKVVFTILAAFGLVATIQSCTDDTASDQQLYEQGIDNDEVKDDDI